MSFYQTLTKWSEIGESLTHNPFDAHQDFLELLGMTSKQALDLFYLDYFDAYSISDNANDIQLIVTGVFVTNQKKYDALVDTFPFSAMRRKVRTPSITHSVAASSSGSASVTRNQTETQTETPNGYGQTRTHSVAPFDTETLKQEYQDSITNNGTRTVSTYYSGSPDSTSSSSSGTRTDTETGTETTTETVIGSDKLSMAESMRDMAAAASVWKIIEMDIAAKLFVQVWR